MHIVDVGSFNKRHAEHRPSPFFGNMCAPHVGAAAVKAATVEVAGASSWESHKLNAIALESLF